MFNLSLTYTFLALSASLFSFQSAFFVHYSEDTLPLYQRFVARLKNASENYLAVLSTFTKKSYFRFSDIDNQLSKCQLIIFIVNCSLLIVNCLWWA